LNISSPKAAIEAIETELRKFASKDKFQTMYFLDNFNMTHRDKLKITIESTKDLFDKFIIEGYKKGNWEPLVVEVNTYWKE
jgi:molybdopterin-guanine dinucleotide biosynthesis protein